MSGVPSPHREQGSSHEALQAASMHNDRPGSAPVSSQHQELVETIRAGLTSSEPMMAARREGRVALDSLIEQLEAAEESNDRWQGWHALQANELHDLKEQLETAKDNSPTIGAAYLRLKEQLEAQQEHIRRAAACLDDALALVGSSAWASGDVYPASEPCECGRPTSVCKFSCDFCTGGVQNTERRP